MVYKDKLKVDACTVDGRKMDVTPPRPIKSVPDGYAYITKEGKEQKRRHSALSPTMHRKSPNRVNGSI
ncbi:MAG: hypothetical protein E3K37_06145 [Candidatus Kuenenia sp.]|nr:hypothetical protein [Candidatus Kuenenia hertensis]